MIIFHEGLPRAGKSYEAMVFRVIPALQKSRHVYSNIKGMDFQKVADSTGMELSHVQQYLHQIEWADTPNIHKLIASDALVILDEAQDFWPVRAKMSDEITAFITQHGHLGLDIVLIGQDLRDVHSLWKRRVDSKFVFIKLDSLGQAGRYTWKSFKATGPEKFQPIASGTRKYDKNYYGVYASHRPDTENKETYEDSRTNILKTPLFRIYLPVAFAIAMSAAYWLYGFFHPVANAPISPPVQQKVVSNATTALPAPAGPVNAPVVPNSSPQSKPSSALNYTPDRYPVYLLENYRPRLAALVRSSSKIMGIVEFLDDSFHVKDSFTFKQLESLGWTVTPTEQGVYLHRYKDDLMILVTQWPIDPFGRVSDYQGKQLSDAR
jgi:zona occludens toxin